MAINVHGDMVPSSVSIVATEQMIEVARVPTCTMPHGSRINPQGTQQYSACMMDDLLVEIDTVEDIDGDGLLEMACIDLNGNLYVWDLPTAAATAVLPWPMFAHDAQQTTAKGKVTITVNADAANGISQINIWADLKSLQICRNATTCVASWNVSNVSPGGDTITASALDNTLPNPILGNATITVRK